MGSRFMDYPSPRGVHVPETYASEDNDPYRRDSASTPRRNRYSRSVHQTPRIRDVTWVSPPDPTPRTPHAPPAPWLPSPQMPSSPAYRPPSVIPPSPAPTVGEHMAVDDIIFAPDDIIDPYAYPSQPQRQSVGAGLIKSVWKGLKKLSGFHSTPHIPRSSFYESQTIEMPVPLSAPSEATQYGIPTPPGTDEQHEATPYASPYVRPPNIGVTPATIPGSLRASPVPVPSMEIPPPITVVSPSIPPSPLPNSIRSARKASPAFGAPRHLSVGTPEPVVPPPDEGSQTLHEHVYPDPLRPPFLPALVPPTGVLKFPTAPALDSPSPSKGSLSSTMARFRRFVSELDELPWVSGEQIADEYVPDMNPRSRLRTRMRQGAEPSWYNERPEVVDRQAYWSEWDMWAKQSTGALWDGVGGEGRAVGWGGGAGVDVGAGAGVGTGGPGQWGMMYPHGYVQAQPGFVYPSGYPPPGVVNDRFHVPVLP